MVREEGREHGEERGDHDEQLASTVLQTQHTPNTQPSLPPSLPSSSDFLLFAVAGHHFSCVRASPSLAYLCVLMQPPRRGRAGIHFFSCWKMCLWIWVCTKREALILCLGGVEKV